MSSALIILFAILLSAYFSGMEIAFLSSNRLQIELDRKQKKLGSEIISLFTANPGQYIATLLIGNNVALVIYGLVVAQALNPLLSAITTSEPAIMVAQTLISTFVILLLAEFIPKTIFRINPNFLLKALSVPTLFFFFLFYPLSKFSLFLSNLILRITTGKGAASDIQENIVFNKVDLDHLLNNMAEKGEDDMQEDKDMKIFQNALDLQSVKIRESMVPRTEIIAVDVSATIEEMKQKLIETNHSKIFVYKTSIDNIIGYFELKDIFKKPDSIAQVMRKVPIVPETMHANKLLKQFVDNKINVALVVDEFGGTSGIITIEDLLEEIVGDIEDEHDVNDLTEKRINDNTYIFSGRLELDYINETYNLNLPEKDDFETLAGLLLYYFGGIPRVNDRVMVGTLTFVVVKATPTRIELVKLEIA